MSTTVCPVGELAATTKRYSNSACPRMQQSAVLQGPERLVGVGFRCWISGYQTGNIKCWEHGWNHFARELGPERAKIAVTELTGWTRLICSNAEREINVCPYGQEIFCQDECIAVSMIAACQHNACPALEACACALLGVSATEPVFRSSTRFARALDEAYVHLANDAICARHEPGA